MRLPHIPAAQTHRIRLDRPAGGPDCRHPAVDDVDARDDGVAVEGGAPGLLGAASHFGGQHPRAGDAVAGGVHRAVDLVGQKGDLLAGLVGAEEVGLDTPHPTRPDLALEVVEAFRRPCDLKAADAGPEFLAVGGIEVVVYLHGLFGEDGHHLGEVDLEHETGRVRGRAARLEHRPLVHDDDVAPAVLRKVVRHARARYAGPDDYDSRMVLHTVCPRSSSRWETFPSGRNLHQSVRHILGSREP